MDAKSMVLKIDKKIEILKPPGKNIFGGSKNIFWSKIIRAVVVVQLHVPLTSNVIPFCLAAIGMQSRTCLLLALKHFYYYFIEHWGARIVEWYHTWRWTLVHCTTPWALSLRRGDNKLIISSSTTSTLYKKMQWRKRD